MELKLAFSPCPNDTFAFHAMINSLVDTEGLSFNVYMADVEELNNLAKKGELDICKLSYHAYFSLLSNYIMLTSGSALGFNNGPLLVKKEGTIFNPNNVIAIPGEHTTAALLLKTAYKNCTNLKPMLFSKIENAILNNEVNAGVLIHEGRFTYKSKGLELITDLGEFWQNNFHHPIPLGGIAVKRNMPIDLAKKINRVLRRSIEYAFLHPDKSSSFITDNAQEITKEVQEKHIKLFVNNFTLDIGEEGMEAVEFMYSKYCIENNFNKNKLFIE